MGSADVYFGLQGISQGSEGIHSALSPCSEKELPCCFPGALCVPVLGAGVKPAPGISNGFSGTAGAWSPAVKGFLVPLDRKSVV